MRDILHVIYDFGDSDLPLRRLEVTTAYCKSLRFDFNIWILNLSTTFVRVLSAPRRMLFDCNFLRNH